MSLARAFTTRRHKRMEISSPTGIPPPSLPDMPALPGQIPSTPIVVRAVSVRNKGAPPIKMSSISSPVQLLSTTNMLSYNAPDIASYRKGQVILSPPDSATSRSSSDESDARSSNSSHHSRETLTDASSVDTSPVSSPRPNDFQGYFSKSTSEALSVRRSKSTVASHRKSISIDDPTPEVPRRAPSHSKRAHQQLARQRSMGNISNHSRGSSSIAGRLSREERASMDFFKTAIDPANPFHKELEQVNELAEELNTTVRDVEMDEDQLKMLEMGLARFHVDDYLIEIQPLFSTFFSEPAVVAEAPAWI